MAKTKESVSGEGTQKVDLSDVKNSDIANAIDEYIHSERDRKILKQGKGELKNIPLFLCL